MRDHSLETIQQIRVSLIDYFLSSVLPSESPREHVSGSKPQNTVVDISFISVQASSAVSGTPFLVIIVVTSAVVIVVVVDVVVAVVVRI